MDDVRYGFYLIPSPETCQAQVQVHQLLERQFQLRVAGKFMPHATIKGFFKTSSTESDLIDRLGPVANNCKALSVHNGGVASLAKLGIGLTIQHLADGSRNEPLQELHEAAIDVLSPVVSPGCSFSNAEWIRERFHAHLTLAMADVPPEHFEEIDAFVRALEPIGPSGFVADRLHLYRFHSDDWSSHWWDSLTWTLRHSWQLA